MKIRIPKRLKDFTLVQMRDTLHLLAEMPKDQKPDVKLKAQFVSVFSGVDIITLLDADKHDIDTVYEAGLRSFSTHERGLPPDEIKIEGKTYERLRFEDGKTKGGWFVDCKTMNSEFSNAPELLAALNYIEKGKRYAEKDRHGHITNPTRERAELFKTEFPPDVFLNLHAFFLSLSESWNTAFLTLQIDKVLKKTKEAKTIMAKN